MDVYAYLLLCIFIGLIVAILICEIFDKVKAVIRFSSAQKYTEKYIAYLERENRSMRRTLDYIRFEKIKKETGHIGGENT